MPRQLATRSLNSAQVDQAYPLVQLAVPRLPLAAWRRFAGASIATSRGDPPHVSVMVVSDARGYLQGLCVYRVEPDLRHGRRMTIEHFVALDLIDSTIVAEAIVAALRAEAVRAGCGILETHLPHDLMLASPSERQLLGLLKVAGEEESTRHIRMSLAQA